MTLKKKILIGYSVAFILMVLVVCWAVINLISLGEASEAILRENYRSILAAENMIDALKHQDRGLLLIFLDNDERGVIWYKESEKIFLSWLVRAKGNITVKGEGDIIRSIEKDYIDYRSFFQEFALKKYGVRNLSLLRIIYQRSIYPLFEKVYQGCIRLRNLNERAMYSSSNRANFVAKRAIFSTLIVALSALIIAFIFSLLLSEKITRPLRDFMFASRRIAKGDYKIKIPIRTSDELGSLATEFNKMAGQLERYRMMNIEQVLAEKSKSEAVLASIDDGIITFDTELKVTSINHIARRILDLNSSEQKVLKCSDIFHHEAINDYLRKTVRTGVQPRIPEEKKIIALQDGDQTRHYLYSITTIRTKKKQLRGVVLLLKDVTRLKEVERLKSEFVMSASHELRTPLTSMGMSIALLLEHTEMKLGENDLELLKTAQEEVNRLKALVNDLLDLSKIEMGRIHIEFEEIPVYPLAEQVQTVFKSQMEEKSVSLKIKMEKNLPKINADPNKIIWVMTNLISNALRYVKAGGQIEIRAEKEESKVRFSVIDDGPGIPPEYHSKIFQKFVKVEGREEGGTGLGLAICKEIVNAHGGTIWVESVRGEGSTFIFTLPAVL
jgi:NtrC-family two-component system sensor histidine kinase KinB